jgi:hypothetical protein
MVIFWGKKSIFDHLKIEDLLRNISPNGKNSTKKKKKTAAQAMRVFFFLSIF